MNTTIHRVKRAAYRRGITLQRIADAAGVTRAHVCNVLCGRFKSRRVVRITRDLIAQHDAAQSVERAS